MLPWWFFVGVDLVVIALAVAAFRAGQGLAGILLLVVLVFNLTSSNHLRVLRSRANR
jgi:hypothetical protein